MKRLLGSTLLAGLVGCATASRRVAGPVDVDLTIAPQRSDVRVLYGRVLVKRAAGREMIQMDSTRHMLLRQIIPEVDSLRIVAMGFVPVIAVVHTSCEHAVRVRAELAAWECDIAPDCVQASSRFIVLGCSGDD